MKPQLTVGLVEFGTVAAYVILFTIVWRAGAAALGDRPAGRAMAAAYS